MLKHIENISTSFVPHFLSKKGHVCISIGNKVYNLPKFRLTRGEYATFVINTHDVPFRFEILGKRYWLFKEEFYKDTDKLNGDEVKALLLTRERLKEERINRAKTLTAAPAINAKPKRNMIPEDVKLIVWQRDEGHCCKCNSQSELQFDHIIPVSLGGASTPENLQVLCGKCNRAKRNSVVNT